MHFLSNVSKKITKEDIYYINKIVGKITYDPSNVNFEKQIELITKVQNSVLDLHSLEIKSIPLNSPREPKNYFLRGSGQCQDRSRVIEKILNFYGFNTIHVAVYKKEKNYPLLKLFFKKNLKSHALTAVKTSNGWVLVDSIKKFISINNSDNVVNLDTLPFENKWKFSDPMDILVNENFIIYGLYSRHGKFFKPYNLLPDINYSELMYNFIL